MGYNNKKKKEERARKINEFFHDVEADGNLEQMEAVRKIFRTNENLFITGKAGTGKSTFLRRLKPLLEKTCVVAPTGIAALNIEGVTIHSLFSFDVSPFIPKIEEGKFTDNANSFVKKDKYRTIANMETLIIDEVSMLRADLLDRIGSALRKIKNSDLPFGGVRIIMFGDLSQLPPVFRGDFNLYDYYDTKFFFSSKSLMASGYSVIEFKKVYRQNDEKFINSLNSIRDGSFTKEDEDLFRSRIVGGDSIPSNSIYICSTNAESKSINDMNLAKVQGYEFEFEAIMHDNYPKDAPCEQLLTLKIGARVIITKNGAGYVNGSLGVVTDVKYVPVLDENGEPVRDYKTNEVKQERVIFVRIDGHDKDTKIPIETWSNMQYTVVYGELVGVELGSITQYPIRLGYSISAHKSQGMTLESDIIKMDRAFEPGQIYTAISRCKSLDGLYLTSMIDAKRVGMDPEVKKFWENVHENNGQIEPVPMEELEDSLNGKSLKDLLDF